MLRGQAAGGADLSLGCVNQGDLWGTGQAGCSVVCDRSEVRVQVNCDVFVEGAEGHVGAVMEVV